MKQKGFTLVEILMVLVVLTILVSTALYNYSNYLLRTNRTDAMKLLLEVAARQENYYSFKYKYTSKLSDLGLTSDKSEYGFYNITITLDNDDKYFQLIASPIGSQQKDICGTFQLDSNGVKKTSQPDCWK